MRIAPLSATSLLGALAASAVAQSASAQSASAQPAAHALPPAVAGDVRCLMTMVALANVNKDHPQAGQIGAYFFAGRLSVRAPTLDLPSAVKAVAPTLQPQQLDAELKRCGPIVAAASKKFQAAMGPRPASAGPAPGAPPAAAPPAAAAAPAPK